MQKNGGGAAAAAPTGCFKCGRPVHWSRDCPYSGPGSSTNPNLNQNPKSGSFPPKPPDQISGNLVQGPGGGVETTARAPTKTRKPPRTRPKLTADMLLSEDGLGYVLKHFPRAIKCRGRGHEVEDLGNLISLYAQWHKHLIPYYSFNQFTKKVEQLGTAKRVRMCLRELKERVAKGGDPTKLHERPAVLIEPNNENEMDAQTTAPNVADPPFNDQVADDVPEELFDEIYQNATEETFQPTHEAETSGDVVAARENSNTVVAAESPSHLPKDGIAASIDIQLTEEQKARMEANRLKALERAAAARARALQGQVS